MMHNGYFYPDDVIIDGTFARLGFSLPTIWTDAAKSAADKCWISGWEMARLAHRKAVTDAWYRLTYPDHWADHERFKAWIYAGGTVTGYHTKAAE